jgi:uncharacterized protein YjbJ (UPF0337 family)
MSDDIIIGGLNQAAGRVERAVGAIAGDPATEISGAARELGGAAQQTFGEAKAEVAGMASESPLGIFLAGVSVGLMVGLFISRR